MAKLKNKERADGRLQSKVYLGNGKYKYVYASTNKELSQKVAEIKTQLGKGLDISAQRDSFKSWADRWLKIKKTEVSAQRYLVYKSRVKNLEPLYSIPISKIRTMDIQEIIIDNLDYSKSVIKEIKSTAKQILQIAVDNRVIDYNPAISVKIPNKADVSDRRALTEVEQTWITDTPHRAKTPAMIMMYAGLRRGELIPLLWTDIDLSAKTISVNKSVERVDNKLVLKDGAKTSAGDRVVDMPDVLVEYLSQIDRGTNMLVCPSAKGKMMSNRAWECMWTSYIVHINNRYGDFTPYLDLFKKRKSAKKPIIIPHITAHWLRHTFITLMYMAGVDVLTAMKQAGHADIQTTMQIYTHLDSVHKRKQMDKFNNYINGEDGCQMGVK